ncbi:unnamed protein product [Soboliphyme baturini]|uniref:Uncharacterized protein n=1 Tax=Soboliphyme baturini TaxID=241478 RepID=A0A3P8B7G9_9BILA|nr:unnamed protein product [Soboliphyme baturini]
MEAQRHCNGTKRQRLKIWKQKSRSEGNEDFKINIGSNVVRHAVKCCCKRDWNIQLKCAFGLLHCVQTFRTLHFSRRQAGADFWQPFALEVPSGCECMWPVEEFGSLNRRNEL